MNTFALMQNDGYPVIRAELSDASGVVDLSGANCYFIYRGKYVTGTAPLSGVADILNASGGQIEYAWTPDDTANPGVYYGYWRVSGANNLWSSYPPSYFRFLINPAL